MKTKKSDNILAGRLHKKEEEYLSITHYYQ